MLIIFPGQVTKIWKNHRSPILVMMTSWHGKAFRLTVPCEENPPVTGGFPYKGSVMRNFDFASLLHEEADAAVDLRCRDAQGAVLIYRCCLTSTGSPWLKIRRSRDCLIFNMGIPIPGRTAFVLRRDPGHVNVMFDVDVELSHYRSQTIRKSIILETHTAINDQNIVYDFTSNKYHINVSFKK